ncbi:DUF4331 family protein [Paraliomyxa miuraensis]|uniref:DUF4331 family protein n=1 Tax=Paraliomyxa miuraensis TaxID=376150 RepID=UPI002259DBE3|nr:DUF4331 family protein [Paraliomyxa miuraensis]MCX4243140.1 DUF4331 domain-containing protein [Paraliomyxa miuraensis]
MKSFKLALPTLAVAGLVLAGCPADDAPPGSDSSTGEDSTTTAGPTTTPPPTTTGEDTTEGTTVMPTTTVGETEDTESSTTGPEVGPYVFDDTAFEDYLQVDRMGFPAINTGLNLLGDKDAYNMATPDDDANLVFLPNILDSFETLHIGAPMMQTADNTGLDDDLITLGLAPCDWDPSGPGDDCVEQGGPFAIPDTLKIALDQPAGFPNGRELNAPVMDLILAVLLLDLNAHAITTFLDLDGDMVPGPSLNPLENDVPFDTEFPYLAPAHQ